MVILVTWWRWQLQQPDDTGNTGDPGNLNDTGNPDNIGDIGDTEIACQLS